MTKTLQRTEWINESVHIQLSDFLSAAAGHISRTEDSTNCLLDSSLSVCSHIVPVVYEIINHSEKGANRGAYGQEKKGPHSKFVSSKKYWPCENQI